MKKIALFILLFSSILAQAQNPVKWRYSVNNLPNNEAELVLTATIEKGWHLYSQFLPEGGPIVTSFMFPASADYVLIGKVKEGKAQEEFDPNFDMVLKYFSNNAVFKQKIKVKTNKDFTLKGELEFMVCNDQMCLPPEIYDTEFKVKGAAEVAPTTTDSAIETATDNTAIVPTDTPIDTSGITAAATDTAKAATTVAETATVTPAAPEESKSLVGIFIFGFLAGLAALFMPCIFPMIPLTVSFFTKQSKTKREGVTKAIIYGVSIIVIYVALGMAVSLAFGADALNQLSTNPIFNILFFVLFIVFALSFFGAYEITLPSSWVNKADNASNKGGMIGIFFMAFTLSLVSFSCTGPLIGTLLVEAATKGEVFGPAVGMFAFALALALPFALFAAFPGWLNSMPKSGGWLNTVKVTLGFLELAFAFKFLSTADMVSQTHFLEREFFMAIWVGITFLLVLYLLGVFLTPNDSKTERIGVGRLMFATVFAIFGFYMMPGIWGAPVKLISGFPPPEHYAESKGGAYAVGTGGGAATSEADINTKFGDHCPFDLNCFNDFETGLAYAKKVGKPVMLDFTGWGCVNCRRMEENVWSDPRVLSRLRENVVLISLYVDERTKLPEDKQYVSEKTGRKIRNVGNVWTEFQETNFGAVSQPYYLILGHDSMTPLLEPAAYDPDIDKFIDWLDRGVTAFDAKK